MEFRVCGNSNMRNLSEDEIREGRSHKCSEDDPCDICLLRLGRIKFKELKDKSSPKKERKG